MNVDRALEALDREIEPYLGRLNDDYIVERIIMLQHLRKILEALGEPEYQQPKLKPGYVEDMIPIPRSVAKGWFDFMTDVYGRGKYVIHDEFYIAIKTALGQEEL